MSQKGWISVSLSDLSNMDELQAKLREAFGKIYDEIYLNAYSDLEHRLDFLRATNGELVEVGGETMVGKT